MIINFWYHVCTYHKVDDNSRSHTQENKHSFCANSFYYNNQISIRTLNAYIYVMNRINNTMSHVHSIRRYCPDCCLCISVWFECGHVIQMTFFLLKYWSIKNENQAITRGNIFILWHLMNDIMKILSKCSNTEKHYSHNLELTIFGNSDLVTKEKD